MERHMHINSGGERDLGPAHEFPRPRLVESISTNRAPGDRGDKNLDDIIARVAPSRVSVLITGETGVGKDVLAHRIHDASPRAKKPMVCLNCASVCESLIDSELFGHQRGAFTGADQARTGLIEAADGGTLFLDEVGELSLTAQTKLLRVLETRQVMRVGAVSQRVVDVRFIAATNRDIDSAIAQGRFRTDLLFRLEGIRLNLPPLRERAHEILPAAEQFLREYSQREDVPRPVLTEAAERALFRHDWTGNFRELRNVVERAAVLCDLGRIEARDLQFSNVEIATYADPIRFDTHDAGATDGGGAGDRLVDSDVSHERQRIVSALQACAGNQTRAARMLGISRRTLLTRLDTHAIPRPKLRPLAMVTAGAR